MLSILTSPLIRAKIFVNVNQLKSLETTLAGALRREQMAEMTIRQLEAEIEQLNRLVLSAFFFCHFLDGVSCVQSC